MRGAVLRGGCWGCWRRRAFLPSVGRPLWDGGREASGGVVVVAGQVRQAPQARRWRCNWCRANIVLSVRVMPILTALTPTSQKRKMQNPQHSISDFLGKWNIQPGQVGNGQYEEIRLVVVSANVQSIPSTCRTHHDPLYVRRT